jgi:hypothetical protein
MTSTYPLVVASRGLVGTSGHNWWQPVDPTPRPNVSTAHLQWLIDNANATAVMRVGGAA